MCVCVCVCAYVCLFMLCVSAFNIDVLTRICLCALSCVFVRLGFSVVLSMCVFVYTYMYIDVE